MAKKNTNYFTRMLSLTLFILSSLILPLLLWSSFFMKKRIEQAYEKWGFDETIKLINIWGIFGLITVLFRAGYKKQKTNR
ncbi:MAG: hypothetical protein ACFFD2_19765 [Promethearchaeota archaeon]